jgi:site-specific DNA-methyltransferase (adenine-specific)
VKPYYERDGIVIYHGRCEDVLPTLEAGCVDLVLTDPPYGETSLEWDVRVAGWLPLLPSLMTPSASLWCFGSLRFFMEESASFVGWNHAQEIVWEKHNGSIFHADRFRRVHELVVHLYPDGTRWGDVYKRPQTTPDVVKHQMRRKARPTHSGDIGAATYVSEDGGPRLMRSVLQVRSCHGYAQHPTQKPIGIVTPLVEYSCPVGGLILDPFMGSGTTLRAAMDLGRRAIGIEREERYCEIAAKRLQQSVLPLLQEAA